MKKTVTTIISIIILLAVLSHASHALSGFYEKAVPLYNAYNIAIRDYSTIAPDLAVTDIQKTSICINRRLYLYAVVTVKNVGGNKDINTYPGLIAAAAYINPNFFYENQYLSSTASFPRAGETVYFNYSFVVDKRYEPEYPYSTLGGSVRPLNNAVDPNPYNNQYRLDISAELNNCVPF